MEKIRRESYQIDYSFIEEGIMYCVTVVVTVDVADSDINE